MTGLATDMSDTVRGSSQRTYLEATTCALARLLDEDPRLFVVGIAGGPSQSASISLHLLRQKAPTRVREVPFCERGLIGLCLGASLAGAKPIIDLTAADNLLYAVGDLAHHLQSLPYLSRGRLRAAIVIRMAVGAALSSGPFQSGNYHAAFAQLSDLHMVAPMTAAEACGLLTSAVRADKSVLLLEHRQLFGLSEECEDSPVELPLTQAVVVREGRHLTITSYGYITRIALQAADLLVQDDIQAEVLHLRSLVPLDRHTLVGSVAKTGRVLFVDDGVPNCSILCQAAADVATHAFDYLDAPPLRLHGPEEPTPYSPALEGAWRPSAEQIAAAARQLLAM